MPQPCIPYGPNEHFEYHLRTKKFVSITGTNYISFKLFFTPKKSYMEENLRLKYDAPETTVTEVPLEGCVMRHSHQHDTQSEWES